MASLFSSSWVQTTPLPVFALARRLRSERKEENQRAESFPSTPMDSSPRSFAELKPLFRKFFLRILLFALILTALHFIYILHDGSSSGSSVYDGFLSVEPLYNSKTYETHVQLHLKKTLNPQLKKLWTSKEWRRQVSLFVPVFQNVVKQNLLMPGNTALCIAAGVGQEVLALKEIGVTNSIGVDLDSSPPLVVKGDMYTLPFKNDTFDFEFSNAFDHALFPAMLASEIERTLKPGGVVMLHLSWRKRTDKNSANELNNVESLVELFSNFDVMLVKETDALGMGSEIVFRKRKNQREDGGDAKTQQCSSNALKQKILNTAEPLILEEPSKPWITLKENAKKIKYVPSFADIRNHRQHIYVDIGARSYASSIGSWFVKRYPKQNQDFFVYAIEADESFAADYLKRKKVQLLPYAAWLRNESLVFGANAENRAVEGEIGMGRIQGRSALQNEDSSQASSSRKQFRTVQGLDFSEWLKKTVSIEDFVVMKMDIEGTEFDLLPRMFETGAICLVDELFLECHYNRWQRTSPSRTSKFKRTYSECLSLFQALRNNGVLVHQWW